MNDSFSHLLLKVLRRKVYPCFFKPYIEQIPCCEQDLQISNDIIFNVLSKDDPCMISRIGANEMNIIANYIFIKRADKNIIKYIRGYGGEWWWNKNSILQLQNCAGVWPATEENAERFAKRSILDIRQIDVLGSWLTGENLLSEELACATKVHFFNLEPFFAKNPWTRVLEGKKVLVVHPFAETIEKQYTKRKFLFENANMLPDFHLITVKAVQSLGGNSQFENWFEALSFMEDQVSKIDFDIAILGCGAYGLSLAAYIKKIGKKAIHLGGVTQLLFGIRGRRWEQTNQTWYKNGYYPDLMNEYWCRPDESEKPVSANKVEGACYW